MTDTFNKLEYRNIPKEKLTGEKWMEKSVNIGISFRKSLEFIIHIRLTIMSSMCVSRNFMEGIWTIGTS